MNRLIINPNMPYLMELCMNLPTDWEQQRNWNKESAAHKWKPLLS